MRCLRIPGVAGLTAGLLAVAPISAKAQANLPIYTDRIVNGFQDWSWGLHTFTTTSPVHSGTMAISASNALNEAISLYHPDFDTSLYQNLSFWVHGGVAGGQVLRIQALLGLVAQPGTNLPALPANTWQQFNINLAAIGAANKTNFDRFWIQRAGGTANPYYLDDIQLIAKPAPAVVNLSVNATQTLRSADSRWFGINTAIWDGNFDTAQTISLLNEMGTRILRGPGGSLSDEYHWSVNRSGTNTFQWTTSFPKFVHILTNISALAFVAVNYGTSLGNSRGGQAKEAAAWVAYANAEASLYGTTNDIPIGLDEEGNDWRTAGYWARLRSLTAASNPDNQFDFLAIGRSAPLAIKYWEIGNELYGTWETDYNTNTPYHKNEGWTYAMRASNYFQFMKMVDPTIKVGVMVTPGEDSYQNGYTFHGAVNPRTSQTHYGWTPVLLATLKSMGITPDFAVHHVYPEYTGGESDPLLLQASSSWARDAADLRRQITDYFGAGGTNIELVCTENNSNSGSQGKQSTSLVNGLYYADSLGQLMKTEFNAFVWWDLRNGTDNSGSFDSTLYGWRTFGDLGLINNLSTRLPPFYAAKLMQNFVRTGDKIVGASSDYPLLSAFASRSMNGAISLLVLNKDRATNFNAQIAVNGFVPNSSAVLRAYGIPQDEAARTNAPLAAQDISVTNFPAASATFGYNFPPLSLTLFTLAPSPPKLVVLPLDPGGQILFQLQGQPAVRYFIQTANTLTNPGGWVTIATNTLVSGTLNITNAVPTGARMAFWRAVWQP
jgi:alpha-N-arabinofuranosidase